MADDDIETFLRQKLLEKTEEYLKLYEENEARRHHSEYLLDKLEACATALDNALFGDDPTDEDDAVLADVQDVIRVLRPKTVAN